MTYQVMKSQLPPNFEVEVAKHAKEMKDWRRHDTKVKEDEKNGITGINRHVFHPRPSPHPLIAASVNENDDADYAIVDDGPTADQILRSKKNDLMIAVSRAETEAINEVVPAGKRRYLNMREMDILAGRLADIGAIKKAAIAVGIANPPSLSPEDAKFLDEQNSRRSTIKAIERAAAQAHSDIEDLTAKTIDAWHLPKF